MISTGIYEPFNPVFSQINMKPAQIWITGAEFQPLTHLSQANFCPQAEIHCAAVTLQPIARVMVFLKQAPSRWCTAVWQQTYLC